MADRTPDQRYAERVKAHIREGRGKGTGSAYRPWLTVRTRGLNSNTWRPYGKSGRAHHLLSGVEMGIFCLLDMSHLVTDIREQFPLLPLEDTRRIASDLGCAHPRACPFMDKRLGKVDVVMTTDLLVDVADLPDLPPNVAISVKKASDLEQTTPRKLANLLNKAEIERRYWAERGVPFLLVTDEDVPGPVRRNVDLLHRYVSLKGMRLPAPVGELADHLLDLLQAAPGLAVSAHGEVFDRSMGLARGSGTSLAWHCLATGAWAADLTRTLEAGLPIHELRRGLGSPEVSR